MGEEISTIIKEVGFPIAVAMFVLIRLNGKMDRLTEALYAVKDAMLAQTAQDIVHDDRDARRDDRNQYLP